MSDPEPAKTEKLLVGEHHRSWPNFVTPFAGLSRHASSNRAQHTATSRPFRARTRVSSLPRRRTRACASPRHRRPLAPTNGLFAPQKQSCRPSRKPRPRSRRPPSRLAPRFASSLAHGTTHACDRAARRAHRARAPPTACLLMTVRLARAHRAEAALGLHALLQGRARGHHQVEPGHRLRRGASPPPPPAARTRSLRPMRRKASHGHTLVVCATGWQEARRRVEVAVRRREGQVQVSSRPARPSSPLDSMSMAVPECARAMATKSTAAGLVILFAYVPGSRAMPLPRQFFCYTNHLKYQRGGAAEFPF